MAEGIIATDFLEKSGTASLTTEDSVVADRLEEYDAGEEYTLLISTGEPLGDIFKNVGVLALGIIKAGCINKPNTLAIKLEVGNPDILSA